MSDYSRWCSKIKYSTNSDCWLWTGATYRRHYGHFRRKIEGKWIMAKAHRYAYEHYNNSSIEAMKGFMVCHSCDNPSCVNPSHLFLGTALSNMQDCINKGRHFVPTRDPKHKLLSKEIAHAMRNTKIVNPNLTYKELGRLYGTSAVQAHRIIHNKIWK